MTDGQTEVQKQIDIERLEKIVAGSNHCPYDECCEYLLYEQCVNHSYVLCKIFEANYEYIIAGQRNKRI